MLHSFLSRWLLLLMLGCAGAAAGAIDPWAEAQKNAAQAGEAFSRSRRVLYTYYTLMGDKNALLPESVSNPWWFGSNPAADLYPHLTITAWMLDRGALNTFVKQTMVDEILLTTRVGWLVDRYQIYDGRFENATPDMPTMIFDAAEFVKDGLLPMIDVMDRNVDRERADGLLQAVMANAPVQARLGRLPSGKIEPCGDMLQNFCRLYASSGNPKYKQWAELIGESWMMDVMAKNNDLPCHEWDFARGVPVKDWLNLNDHGNELMVGLSELLLLEHIHNRTKRDLYLPYIQKMFDKLLMVAVNPDGVWYEAVQPSTAKVAWARTPDTWGYMLNAVYVMYQVTGQQKYLDAVKRMVRGIYTNPKYLEWGDHHDAYDDSLESGIYMYNRLKDPLLMPWMDKMARRIMAFQKDDGFIRGSYLDGNFCRTMMLYGMMKSGGATLRPWREDLKIGAYIDNRKIYLYLSAEKPWQGTLHLDSPRHKLHMGLQVNYPRLNHYPQWYTAEPTKLFDVRIGDKRRWAVLGDELHQGLPITLAGGQSLRIDVRPSVGPPYHTD